MVSLRLEAVAAGYGRKIVVSGVTTSTIEGGQIVAVIGPNAAGKSTLFKRIAGLIRGSGTVEVLNPRAAGRTLSYMPQDISANAVLTVYESILLARKQGSGIGWGVKDGDLGAIDEVIAALGIQPIAFRNLGELSGGQRQLVAIAQSLVRDPEILLMDEPTSALDLHRQVEVLGLMQQTARRRGMIVLIALHDLNQALRFADQTIVIVDGRMTAVGRSSEVINVDLLRDVYRVQARIENCSRGFPHVIVDGTTGPAVAA